jgi:hypothetical protein
MPAPIPSPAIPSPKTVPIKPTSELSATDSSKEAASVPQDSPTITSSITPTTAIESIVSYVPSAQIAGDTLDLNNGSTNNLDISQKDKAIIASMLASAFRKTLEIAKCEGSQAC